MIPHKQLRLRRFMGRGRAVIVALDHGNVAGVVPGLETPVKVVKLVAQAGADGIVVTPGILEQVIEHVGDLAVVLRIDGCVTGTAPGPMRLFGSIEDAVRMGADGVIISATLGTPHESAELEKVGIVATASRRWGMPVVAEMLTERMARKPGDPGGNGSALLPGDLADDAARACRIAVELGADAVKTRYSGDPDRFQRTVLSTGRPVLVGGGPHEPELEPTLRMVDEVLQAGAAGVLFGRTIWQQPDTTQALRALCAMVHEDATVEEALEKGLR